MQRLPQKRTTSFLRQLALAMELPFVLVGGVVFGGGLGWLLDHWLHTTPWLMLLAGLLGFAGGVWDILKQLSREEKKEQNDADK